MLTRVTENVKVAFPHFYERNIDNVSFKIIVQYDTVSYTACVVSGSDNKTFIASVASENVCASHRVEKPASQRLTSK